MDKRAALSIALIVVGLGASAFVAFGVWAGAPQSETPRVQRAAGKFLSEIATPDEYQLWNVRGCSTCHGAEARGGPMGPDLTRVIPLYLAKFGSAAAAKTEIAAYLIDPAGSPKLRGDGEVFPNPMPALERMFQGRREEAPVLATMLLRLAE